jgi:hypothetical protein
MFLGQGGEEGSGLLLRTGATTLWYARQGRFISMYAYRDVRSTEYWSSIGTIVTTHPEIRTTFGLSTYSSGTYTEYEY